MQGSWPLLACRLVLIADRRTTVAAIRIMVAQQDFNLLSRLSLAIRLLAVYRFPYRQTELTATDTAV